MTLNYSPRNGRIWSISEWLLLGLLSYILYNHVLQNIVNNKHGIIILITPLTLENSHAPKYLDDILPMWGPLISEWTCIQVKYVQIHILLYYVHWITTYSSVLKVTWSINAHWEKRKINECLPPSCSLLGNSSHLCTVTLKVRREWIVRQSSLGRPVLWMSPEWGTSLSHDQGHLITSAETTTADEEADTRGSARRCRTIAGNKCVVVRPDLVGPLCKLEAGTGWRVQSREGWYSQSVPRSHNGPLVLQS